MKTPSVISFIVLLSIITALYVMFMSPIATGSYHAFENDNFQEYSDDMIITMKTKIDNLFKC